MTMSNTAATHNLETCTLCSEQLTDGTEKYTTLEGTHTTVWHADCWEGNPFKDDITVLETP